MMDKIKIQFIDIQGLEYDDATLEQKGLGGSEAQVVYMSRELHKLGFDVYVYNNCENEGEYNGIHYKNFRNINCNIEYDIVISERSTYPFLPMDYKDKVFEESKQIARRDPIDISIFKDLKQKKKIIRQHDYTVWGEFQLSDLVLNDLFDEFFVLSDFHQIEYLKKTSVEKLNEKIWKTRNGIKPGNYNNIDIWAKDPNMFVVNYNYSKGVPLQQELWDSIKKKINNPNQTLHIIGGFYLFKDKREGMQNDMEQLKEKYKDDPSIIFHGFLPQDEVFKLLTKQSFFLYPATFPETYGISLIECIQHNVLPICVNFGSIKEVQGKYSLMVPNNTVSFPQWNDYLKELFINHVQFAYTNQFYSNSLRHKMNEVKKFLTWDKVQIQWQQHLYNLLGIDQGYELNNKQDYINQRTYEMFNGRIVNDEHTKLYKQSKNRKLVVISPVRNQEKYIRTNIISVQNQRYDNYIHIVINDQSTDNTAIEIKDQIKYVRENISNERQDKIKYINNDIRKYALTNQLDQIAKFSKDPDDIIILLDGDDWLQYDPNIFTYINDEYDYHNYRMTYGSSYGFGSGLNYMAQSYPDWIHDTKEYRRYMFEWKIPMTHLRTFKRELIQKIPQNYFVYEEDLYEQYKHKPYTIQSDVQMMLPMLELCNKNEIGVINKLTMIYNDQNDLNDYKTQEVFQNQMRDEIYRKPKLLKQGINEYLILEDDLDQVAEEIIQPNYVEEEHQDWKKETIEFPNVQKKIKLLIATPTNKSIENDMQIQLYNMNIPSFVEPYYSTFYAYSVQQMRNLIVKNQINYIPSDYILWIDSDIVVPQFALERMLDSKKQFVTGYYRQRKQEIIPEIYYINQNGGYSNFTKDQVENLPEISEIGACGFGCVLTDVNLFKQYEYPWFVYHETYDFKDTLSEDVDACIRIFNQTKVRPWLDKTIKCQHIGKFNFGV